MKEQQASWKIDADVVEAKVAKMSSDFLEVYASASKAIANLFTLMAQVDKEVSALNSRAPWGVRHLRCVELAARGISEFGNLHITEKVVLPPLILGNPSGAIVNQWPPAPINVGFVVRLVAQQFIAYFNATMAKPFRWTYAGKPLTGIGGLIFWAPGLGLAGASYDPLSPTGC